MFAVATFKSIASEVSMATCENPEPGLVTETILNPSVLGNVMPASDLV